MLYQIAALILCAYLLGSVPFGLIIGKVFYRVDIREHGSGNIGATNSYRTLGPVAGAGVLTADALKGLVPVLIARWVLGGYPDIVPLISVLTGVTAIVGHSYSVFLGFSGGKGMATAAGMVIALWPWAAPILFGTWVAIIAITRYVSLASIVIAVVLPFLVAGLYPRVEYIGFSIAVAIVLVYRHRSNISRLLAGEELKIGKKVSLGED